MKLCEERGENLGSLSPRCDARDVLCFYLCTSVLSIINICIMSYDRDSNQESGTL